MSGDLIFSGNKFHGTIPTEIGRLTNVRFTSYEYYSCDVKSYNKRFQMTTS